MKIFHTSDWHLGQYFMGQSREAEHQQFFDWLLRQVEHHQPDILIIAGDIFDTGTPPSYARKLYMELMSRLSTSSVRQTFVLAGNHDSVSVLNESASLLSAHQIHVIAGIDKSKSPDSWAFPVKQGETLQAVIGAVPYLRPQDIQESIAGQTQQEKQQSLQRALANWYQHVFAACTEIKTAYCNANNAEEDSPEIPIIMTGHLAVLGCSLTESVRDIYIGSLDAFSTSHFPPADYIALGHIHRRQIADAKRHIHYCGSPIPLSFDEVSRPKQLLMVDFDSASNDGPQVTEIEIPCFQALITVKGDLKTIATKIQTLVEDGTSAWLEIVVQNEAPMSDLAGRIAEMIGEAPLKVLRIKREVQKRQRTATGQLPPVLQELSPDDVFARRLALESDNLDDAMTHALQTAWKSVRQLDEE